MKQLLCALFTLAALAAALCVSAAAEEAAPTGAPAEEPEQAPAFVRVWGRVSPWDGDGILLKNGNKNDPLNEVVVHPGEAPAVDAVTGLPLDLKSVREGDVLYAWAGPAMTLSLPPQIAAEIIVGNIPAGFRAPEYCEVAGQASAGESGFRIPLSGGGVLEVTDKTAYTPWLTRQIVRMEDLTPGTRALVWKNAEGAAEKVLVFPCACRGYVSVRSGGDGARIAVNGGFDPELDKDVPQIICKQTEAGVMAPIRAVAEAAGYSVSWDKNRGAVVYDENADVVFYVYPGDNVVWTPERGETTILAPCLKEGGTTYLPLAELCRFLNLFLVSE